MKKKKWKDIKGDTNKFMNKEMAWEWAIFLSLLVEEQERDCWVI